MKERNKQKTKTGKESIMAFFSGISGSLSFLGSWQVCHNLCLSIVAALSLIGITIAGMPLLFLTQYAVYFWSIAALLLIPTLILYWKNRKCIPANLILFNLGIVIASVPLAQLQAYQIIFWSIGGVLIAVSLWLFLKARIENNYK